MLNWLARFIIGREGGPNRDAPLYELCHLVNAVDACGDDPDRQALFFLHGGRVTRSTCVNRVDQELDVSGWRREGFERDTADLIREEGLAVIPYSPQAGGFLTGKYKAGQDPPAGTRAADNEGMRRHFTDANFELVEEMARIGQDHGKTVGHVALAWHLSNPLITAPSLGARNAAQLEESLGAVGFRLDEEEMTRLNALTDWRQD